MSVVSLSPLGVVSSSESFLCSDNLVPRPLPSFCPLQYCKGVWGSGNKALKPMTVNCFVVVYFVADTIHTTHDLWTSNLCLLTR